MKQFMILWILTMLLLGCVPKKHIVSPQMEGRVFDAMTKNPLSGVKVGSKQTNVNGHFIIESQKELGIVTPMGGVWRLPTVMLPISKKGYKKIYCTCETLNIDTYGCSNVTIALVPLDKNNLSDTLLESTQNDNFSCKKINKIKITEQ